MAKTATAQAAKKAAKKTVAPKKHIAPAKIPVPPAATTVTGATPTVPATTPVATPSTPTVEPFNTPDEVSAWLTESGKVGDELYNIDESLGNLTLTTQYQAGYTDDQGVYHQGTIDTAAAKSADSAVNDAVARGLGQSSIKDGEINDIASTAAIRKNFLNSTLAASVIRANTRKSQLGQELTDWKANDARSAAGNAEDVNAPTPPTEAQIDAWVTAGTAKPAAPVATAPPTPQPITGKQILTPPKTLTAPNTSASTNTLALPWDKPVATVPHNAAYNRAAAKVAARKGH